MLEAYATLGFIVAHVDGVAKTVRELNDLGFTATYVFAGQMPEPERAVELIAAVANATS